jgi:RHS repeat-associated protein
LGPFDLPLRLPGQYFDKETNLLYNYYRDYDPGIGRYSESDPIALRGGINTYAYVKADPLRQVDVLGLVTAGEASHLGGEAVKALADEILERLGNPSMAGQDAAAELCGLYQGRKPPNLWSDCTTECNKRLDKVKSVSIAASGWLMSCTKSCEEFFPRCNKQRVSLACLY